MFPPNSFPIDIELQAFGEGTHRTVEIPLDYPAGPSGTPEDLLLAATWFYGHQPLAPSEAPRSVIVGAIICLPTDRRYQIHRAGFRLRSPEGPARWKES